MERGKKTGIILRQFRKKNKRIVHKDLFTEFFFLNKDRRIIEFLFQDEKLIIETFFKEFLPDEFKNFINVKIYNDMEEEIKTWYYDSENLVVAITVNWGFKRQEISVDINIENFVVNVVDEKGLIIRNIDYVMFNDYLISFLTLQARNLAQSYESLGSPAKKLESKTKLEKEDS